MNKTTGPLLFAALALVLGAASVRAAGGRGGQGRGRGGGNNNQTNGNQGETANSGRSSVPGVSGPGTSGYQGSNGDPGMRNNGGAGGPDGAAPAVSTEPAAEIPVEEEKPPRDLTLEDARVDFQTVVQTYVDRDSVDGLWPFKTGGRTLRLRLVRFDDKSIRKTGRGRYAGAVVMSEGSKPRVLEFTADFSGANWKVVSVKPLGGGKRP